MSMTIMTIVIENIVMLIVIIYVYRLMHDILCVIYVHNCMICV